MDKKRNSGRSGAAGAMARQNEEGKITTAKYDQDERFADSQDEFFTGKDEIMLEEGPSRKRRKQMEEEDRFLEPSDEEILGYDSDNLDDEEDVLDSKSDSAASHQSNSQDEDGPQDWGTSRADYYDADIIETEADALEEEVEARRLQQKQLQGMTEADFGFDESEWAQAEDERDAGYGIVLEKLPDVVVTEETPITERIKILKSRYPELEPLSRDYIALQPIHRELQIAANLVSIGLSLTSKKRKADQVEPPPSITALKWRALSTYLGSIAMYFVILTAPASGKKDASAPLSPTELRKHPIMQSLLRSRQSWDAVKDLQILQEQVSEDDYDEVPEEMSIKIQPAKVPRAVPEPALEVIKPRKKSKKATSSKPLISAITNPKSHTKNDPSTSSKLNTLDSLISSIKAPSTLPIRSSSHSESESDFGDESPLTTSESLAKSTRKRNLRFYTSQLAQKSNKRNNASHNAGGDADLPYKERLKDRQTRLLQEAEGRGKQKGEVKGPEMDFRDDDDDDDKDTINANRNTSGDAEVDEAEEYYQTLHSASQNRKAQKAAHAASLALAATTRQDAAFFEDPTIEASAKRAITYEISANKGLMPRRKKEVRNPRVKKRMKYDQKMKKLGSVRQVYKGGEGRGGYGGELTGIKTNVVRGVKL